MKIVFWISTRECFHLQPIHTGPPAILLIVLHYWQMWGFFYCKQDPFYRIKSIQPVGSKDLCLAGQLDWCKNNMGMAKIDRVHHALRTVTLVCFVVWVLICSRSDMSLSSDTWNQKNITNLYVCSIGSLGHQQRIQKSTKGSVIINLFRYSTSLSSS